MAIQTENNLDKIIGIVLCGGNSSRMGEDKGLIVNDNGKIWSQVVLDKFIALHVKSYLSINQNQLKTYQAYFLKNHLIIDKNLAHGPLNGLLTVHSNFPNNDILMIACDMKDIGIETIEKLLSQYKKHSGFDFYAFHNGKCWEPMCAIYTSKGLKNYINQKDSSLQQLLNLNTTFKMNIIKEKDNFKNYNYPNDI